MVGVVVEFPNRGFDFAPEAGTDRQRPSENMRDSPNGNTSQVGYFFDRRQGDSRLIRDIDFSTVLTIRAGWPYDSKM